MQDVQWKLEIERIVNLIRAFDWEKVGEKIEDDKITLTLEKKIKSPAVSES